MSSALTLMRINDTADSPVSPGLILVICLAIALVLLHTVWTQWSKGKDTASWAHALDTTRMTWLEDMDAQVLHANDAWCVLIDGKAIAVDLRLRDAIDAARRKYA